MAFRNTSPSSIKNSNSEDFDDEPIVPPTPIAQKVFKEEVPDISVVSLIADKEAPFQNFQINSLRPQTRYVLKENINHKSYQEQLGISSHFPKTISDITEKTIKSVDHSALPFKLCAACESCVLNHALMTNNRYNNENVPNRTEIPIAIHNEHSVKELRCKPAAENIITNKTCCADADSNVIPNSSQKSASYMHTPLLGSLNSYDPEISQTVNTPEWCCCKDPQSRKRKSLPNYERLENKLLCPACFKKNCKCNFLSSKLNAISSKNNCNSAHTNEKLSDNISHTSSEDFSSIWKYLKRLDEKIDSIDNKVSNFLLQHSRCSNNHTIKKSESFNVTERDMPYLFNILGEHRNKIAQLQDQLDFLKLSDHRSLPANDNKIDKTRFNQAETISCDTIENYNEDINCPFSHGVMCDEQTQKVTKASTSTMTSFAFENDDKLVYCKQLTVHTDITREKEESSCLPREHDTSINKDNFSGKNINSNFHKRKSHKLKGSPDLKNKSNTPSNSSSDPPDSKNKQVLKSAHKKERKSKRTSPENKEIEKRCIKDWASEDDAEDQKNYPSLKTDAYKSRSSKQKPKSSLSPKVKNIETKKNSRNKELTQEMSLSSPTSTSSTDSEYISPRQKQEILEKVDFHSEEEPSYLSVATVKYLNKYGLNPRDKNERTESSRKASLLTHDF